MSKQEVLTMFLGNFVLLMVNSIFYHLLKLA